MEYDNLTIFMIYRWYVRNDKRAFFVQFTDVIGSIL